MSRIVFLRHGRTRYNAEARLQGQVDSPLDEIGVDQAAAAGERILREWDVDLVVTSSLARTRETAEAAGLSGHPTVVDDRWREIDFGAYDTRKIADVIADMAAKWMEDIDHEPAGGESMARMHERVGSAWTELSTEPRPSGHVTVVVTHATPIKSAVVHALGGPAEQILQLWLNLASVSVVQVHPALGAVVESYNDIGHLQDDDRLRPRPRR